MPTHDVAGAARPSALLQCAAPRPRAVLLDGGGPDSWGSGDVLYADTPSATLEVFPSGWGRWRADGVERWRWGDPLAQWEAFQRDGGAGAGERDDGAGFLTVLSYELKHWIEVLPRRLSWPRLPVLYCARYDWSYRANYRTGAARIAAARADTLAERLRWYEETTRAATDRGGTACRAPTLARPARRPCLRPTLSREAYCAMLARAHEYIAAGDIYEINLAQRFTAAADRADAPALFAAWSARYRCRLPPLSTAPRGPWSRTRPSACCSPTARAPPPSRSRARAGSIRAPPTVRSPPSCAATPRSTPST
jgi:para-aminobenzoate synthetase component 1